MLVDLRALLQLDQINVESVRIPADTFGVPLLAGRLGQTPRRSSRLSHAAEGST